MWFCALIAHPDLGPQDVDDALVSEEVEPFELAFQVFRCGRYRLWMLVKHSPLNALPSPDPRRRSGSRSNQ